MNEKIIMSEFCHVTGPFQVKTGWEGNSKQQSEIEICNKTNQVFSISHNVWDDHEKDDREVSCCQKPLNCIVRIVDAKIKGMLSTGTILFRTKESRLYLYSYYL